MKGLEKENSRLRRLVADLLLDRQTFPRTLWIHGIVGVHEIG